MRGSVYRRGSTWTARWDLPGAGRHQRSKGGFATKRAAQAFVADQLARQGQGLVDSTETVGQFAVRWLEAIRSAPIAQSTWDGYETHWRIWLNPAIGHMRLSAVSAADLEALYSRIISEGRTARTARYVHATAHRMWRDAIRWGLVGRNPAAMAEPPAQERREQTTWTAEDTALFLEGLDGRWAPMFRFLADSVVRRSELIALRWPAVDLVDGTVTVVKGKTRAARRVISLTEETIDAVKLWRRRQAEERLTAGGSWAGEDRVWTWEDGRPIRPDWLSHQFVKVIAPVLDDDGDPVGPVLPAITLHELRHSWATQALERGVDLVVVQRRLGHSSIRVTADFYTRVPTEVDRAAARAVADAWRAHDAHEGGDGGGELTANPESR